MTKNQARRVLLALGKSRANLIDIVVDYLAGSLPHRRQRKLPLLEQELLASPLIEPRQSTRSDSEMSFHYDSIMIPPTFVPIGLFEG